MTAEQLERFARVQKAREQLRDLGWPPITFSEYLALIRGR